MPEQRGIRSFVLRQGRLTPGQNRALEELFPRFGITESTESLDAEQIFGNLQPITLEIGFGMGDSLAEMAQLHRDRNFLGIDVHGPGIGHLLMRIEALELTNVRVMQADAAEVLRRQITSGWLDRVQVFFPDPWPKKKHHKRRLVSQAFLDHVIQRVRGGGLLHVATDWREYAEEIALLIDRDDRFVSVEPPARPETKYEKRGVRRGHIVTDIAAQVRVHEA